MTLNINDLIKECITCGGTGKKKPQVSSSGGNTFGQRTLGTWGDDSCETCGGDGRVELTESGEAFKQFIQILKKRGQI